MRLARASLILGYVPEAWSGTKMIYIPEACENGWKSPKDFRSISLASFVLKTVKRFVDRYIRNKILTAKPLQERNGHSTETALSKAVNLIEDQLNSKRFAFMDIESALNHASSEVVKAAMAKKGVLIVVVD